MPGPNEERGADDQDRGTDANLGPDVGEDHYPDYADYEEPECDRDPLEYDARHRTTSVRRRSVRMQPAPVQPRLLVGTRSSRRAPALPVVCFRCLVAYYLVERLADGRRLIATHETREGAESHRSVLIMQGRHRADAVFVLEDQPEGEQAEVEKAREE